MHNVGALRIVRVSEVAIALGDLARPAPRKTGTERRAACFGTRAWLRLPVAIKAHCLGTDKLLYLVLYLLFLFTLF